MSDDEMDRLDGRIMRGSFSVTFVLIGWYTLTGDEWARVAAGMALLAFAGGCLSRALGVWTRQREARR